MSKALDDMINFFDGFSNGETEKKAFTPFPDQGAPQLLVDPASGAPFIIDPTTNQPMPATPDMLMQMGIDPAQFGMGPPPQAGAAPAPGGQAPVPPAGAPPQGPEQAQAGGIEEVLAQFDQRIGQLEGAMDQLMQIIEQSQPPPAMAAGQQAPAMGGQAPAGPQMAQVSQMGV